MLYTLLENIPDPFRFMLFILIGVILEILWIEIYIRYNDKFMEDKFLFASWMVIGWVILIFITFDIFA